MNSSKATNAIRIAHIVPVDGIGGVELAANSMARHLDTACDFRLIFLSKKGANPDAPRTLFSSGSSPWSVKSILWAIKTVQFLAPDVIVGSLWRSVPVVLIAKLLLPRTRLVLFLHADRAVHYIDAALTWVGALAADEIWCDSDATLTHRIPSVARSTKRRVISFVLVRGDPVSPISHPKPRFVTWCRLTHQKAIDRSIQLVYLLRKRGLDATFEIWGPDGGMLSALQLQVKNLSLEKYIYFKGVASPDMLPSIASRNCFFLHPSRFEGMAVAVVEAMQVGLIPVVTPTGQMANYVRPSENGILLDPDQLDEAARIIADLILDPAAYNRLRVGALTQWRSAPLYADDFCASAKALASM